MLLKAAFVWLALFLCSGVASANVSIAQSSHIALVIGNSSYANLPDLPNAVRDARAVATRFAALGYTVVHLEDPDQAEILRTLSVMRLAGSKASQVVIYLAGHGYQHGADAYYLASDSWRHLAGSDPETPRGLPLRVFAKTFSDRPRQKIILFDACRTSPGLMTFAGSVRFQSAPTLGGLLIAYAAAPGQVSYDGSNGQSPFASAFLQQTEQPAEPLTEILRKVRLRVVQQTRGEQIPWIQSSLLQPAWLKSAMRH